MIPTRSLPALNVGRSRRLIFIFAAALIAFALLRFGAHVARASDQTWGGGATGNNTAWFTAANWIGGAFPGATPSPANTTNGDIATIPSTGTNPAIGINFNFTGNTLGLGAINFNGADRGVGDSSAVAGTLRLNGATVNGVSNVVIRNFGSGALTVQAAQSGTMGVLLGNSTDNIVNIDGSGGVAIGSAISGTGKKLTKGGAGAGALTLGGANTYSGDTTISAGTLALTGSGSIVNSPNVVIAGGATFDVSGLTNALTLASGQGLKATGAATAGTIATAAGKGLALASNSPLQFTAFDGSHAPLAVSGAGSITLAATNPVTVTVSNGGVPLVPGDYTLISKGAGGGVAGSAPSSVTANGDGVAPGTSASLQIAGQQLVLRVAVRPGALKYRSRQSGNWNDFNTWQVDAGTGFVNAVAGETPSSTDDAITIRNGHVVTVTADVTADQLEVNAGGSLLINNGVTLTVADGGGADLTVDSAGGVNGLVGTAGQLNNNGQAQISGVLRIDQGGLPGGAGAYAYDQTTGTLFFNHTAGTYGPVNAAHTYWPSSGGPQKVAVGAAPISLAVARTVGVSFETSAAVLGANNLTLNGTFTILSGGSVSGSPAYGPASTIIYDTGGPYDASAEFPQSGVNNVTLAGTTQLNLNGDKTITGTFAAGARNVGTTAASPFSLSAATISVSTGTLNLNNVNATSAFNATGAATINVAGDWNAAGFSAGASTVNFDGAGSQTVKTASAFNNLTASNDIALAASPAVNGTLSLGPKKITTGSNTLALGGSAVVTRTTGYVLGALQKTFGATGPFTFHVGTADGYSPVDANVTAGAGALSVRPNEGKQPNISGASALARYWTLSGAGVTTNLTFRYLASDVVAGDESKFKIFEYGGGSFTQSAPAPLDTANHAATINGVSSFSDWTLAEPAAVFGQLQFAQSNTDDAEGSTGSHAVHVHVQRAGGSSGAISVNYKVEDGAAQAGDNDYSVASPTGTLHWADADAADKIIDVTVNGDAKVEPDETINLSLSNAQGGALLGSPSGATLTIKNDDSAIELGGAAYTVGEGDGRVTVTVKRNGPAAGQVTVKLNTSDGTARAGDDYAAAVDQLITFGDNDTADKTFDITVNDDSLYEGPETFNVTLTGATGNSSLGQNASAVVRINDNDKPPPTLTVSTTDDEDYGACLASHCSLREAINAANYDADASTINFQIPPDDQNCDPDTHVCTVTPQSDLPAITERADINGYTQPGSSANTQAASDDAVLLIQLDGLGTNPFVTSDESAARPSAAPSSSARASVAAARAKGSAGRRVSAARESGVRAAECGCGPLGDGLVLAADHSSVRGLVVTRFAGAGVHVAASYCAVAGNFIGTDPSGTLAADGDGLYFGNGLAGVLVAGSSGRQSARNNVGGTAPADRNVVSGSSGDGIAIVGADASADSVLGNFVGTDKSGANASDENGNSFGNLDSGIIVYDSHDNQIGKAVADPSRIGPNVVAASGGAGVEIEAGSSATASGNLIQGNFIGTDLAAAQNLGNRGDGVTVCRDARGNAVGGAGQGNFIANNGGNGVTVTFDSKQANVISQNSIFANALLGIDLGGDGVTDNDAGDADTGPDDYQNSPSINSALVAGGAPVVKGSLNSTPNAAFTIEFFASASCDDSSYGEGQTYLGSLADQSSDGNGDLSFTFDPSSPLAVGQFVTATATNAASGTSEFSQCAEVKNGEPGRIVFDRSSYTVGESVAGGAAQIGVTRAGGSYGKITATFSTSDDTATAGSDYAAVQNATVTFDDGEIGPKYVTVQIIGDDVYEGDESLNLDLSTAAGGLPATGADSPPRGLSPASDGPPVRAGSATARRAGSDPVKPSASIVVGTAHATLTITDDETPPRFSVNDTFVARPQSGTSAAAFTVTLSGPAQAPVSVHYETADGTARQPADYLPASGSLAFAPGETRKTVPVTINAASAAGETFALAVSGASAPLSIDDGSGLATIVAPVAAGQVVISEFRFRGPAGPRDEFVELYNATPNEITVASDDGSPGWSLAAVGPDGTAVDLLLTIPAGTVVPPRAHLLVADVPAASPASGYSLPVKPDLVYDGDIADGAGVALFRTGDANNFSPTTRLDAAGFSDLTTPAADLFREGAGLASPGPHGGEYSFLRRMTSGLPQDTNVNAADFLFVSTDAGSYNGVQSVLGAPGPENLSSPTNRGGLIKSALFDPAVTSSDAPNRARYGAVVTNGAHGTLVLRRTFTNSTAATVKKLRFRVVDATTAPQPADGGTADLRLLDTTGDHVATSTGDKSWVDMKVELPPAQPAGGGYNSTVVATLPDGGLAPGHPINIQFTLGVRQAGSFRFFVIVEALLDSDTTGAADTAAPLKQGSGKPPASKSSTNKTPKGAVVKIN